MKNRNPQRQLGVLDTARYGRADAELAAADKPGPSTRDILAVAEAVTAAVRQAATRVCDGVVRERTLVDRLGVERSLAGRVNRALREQDSRVCLSQLPSFEGLDMLAAAIVKFGEPELAEDIRKATAAYRDLALKTPDGRRGLSRILAATTPSHRDQVDRQHKRNMFRAASDLLGFHADLGLAAGFIFPSQNGNQLDSVHLAAKVGFQRTRPDGTPVSLFSVAESGSNAAPSVMSPIDPTREPDDAWAYMLPEFCEGNFGLELHRPSVGRRQVVLPRDEPGLLERVTLVSGQAISGGFARTATETQTHEWYEALVKVPARRVVLDVFVHRDVFPNVQPTVGARLATGGIPPAPPTLSPDAIEAADTLRVSGEMRHLPYGLEDIGLSEIPDYGDLARFSAEMRGFQLSDFRGSRLTVDHPPVMSSIAFWFELPNA